VIVKQKSYKRPSNYYSGAASMSSQKKARGLPGMKEGPLVQMLDRQRVQQAAADEAKKLKPTQKTCQSRGPLPLCQILFQ
jgi:hypothetical protein